LILLKVKRVSELNSHKLSLLKFYLDVALLEPPLTPSIATALKEARNIQMLYLHQVLAIRALTRGKNVIVSTSTASGKSIIYQVCVGSYFIRLLQVMVSPYQIPTLQFLEADSSSTAIFVYPTKVIPFPILKAHK
jgi:DEAD/DEAH box helicase domain-containing protein